MMTTTRQFLDVRMPGREFTLEGDAALLFQAKVRLGQPFDFDVPGEDGPIRVDFHGLRTTPDGYRSPIRRQRWGTRRRRTARTPTTQSSSSASAGSHPSSRASVASTRSPDLPS
jgi:hypothetical protein